VQFAVQYIDRVDPGDIRALRRAAHVEYRKSLGPALLLAGPLLSDAGAPIGSLVIVEAKTSHDARQLAEADPYAIAGLFQEITVRGYRIMANNTHHGE
jgi:uncharacterized protein YciI